jgi:hypothetical protein
MILSLLFAIVTPLATPSVSTQANAVPAPLATTAITYAQDEPEDKRPEVKDLCAKLSKHIGKRGKEDTEALSVIDTLLQEYQKSGPKDRGLIVKTLGKCYEQKRQPLEEGVPNNRLYLTATVALGEMGKDATKTLMKYIGHKKHRADEGLQRELILALGKTKDPSGVKTLTDLLNNKTDSLIGAAAEALGQFTEVDLKVRKDIFNSLLKVLVTTKAVMDGDAADIQARERFDTIAGPISTTLKDLSGHDGARRPEDWQHWWNKNKKKDWDSLED